MNNDDLSEADMREIMVAQLGRGFTYRDEGCTCDKCKSYRTFKEMWGDRPLPDISRAAEVQPSQNQRRLNGYNIDNEEYNYAPITYDRPVQNIERERVSRVSTFNPKECQVCKTPGAMCIFPLKRGGDGQAICEYCLKCVGCEKLHTKLQQEGIDWVWKSNNVYICRECYSNCRWCGIQKGNSQSLCATCAIIIETPEELQEIDDIVDKLLDDVEPMIIEIKDESEEDIPKDGEMCIMCSEEYKVGQVRFRICSKRPDVHTVCTYECALNIQEWAKKDLIEEDKIIGKQGCPLCHAPINKTWELN